MHIPNTQYTWILMCIHAHTHVHTVTSTHTNYVQLSAFVNNAFSSDLVIPACQRTLTGDT